MIIIYVARIHFLSSISHNLTEANILEKNISKKIYYFKSENLFARAFYFYASKSVGIIIILFVTKKKKNEGSTISSITSKMWMNISSFCYSLLLRCYCKLCTYRMSD